MEKTVLIVTIFSIAFAFVESSVVVYLRHLLGAAQTSSGQRDILFLIPGIAFLEPQAAVKIITDTAILNIERIREAATLVMLVAVAILAGSDVKQRLSFFFLSFGIWDIFYYIFLRLTIGWPRALGDLDIFFLLPTPWVGPVFTPIAISSLLVIGSLLFMRKRGGEV
ncbi:MAG: hypothetical protein HYV40_06705 [Candidatus Levybacteria bacterium]|nr:hypothetical protein [Candidatus Levybacteria bacterium]